VGIVLSQFFLDMAQVATDIEVVQPFAIIQAKYGRVVQR
jgi:hypothetical protein